MLFDLIIGSAFHLLLHLKEYLYVLDKYKPVYIKLLNLTSAYIGDEPTRVFIKSSRKIVKESEEGIPTLMEEIFALLEQASKQIEIIIPQFRENRAVVRFFLFHEDLIEHAYGHEGLEEVMAIMFPGGPIQGFLSAANNFAQSGHEEEFLLLTERALELLKKNKERKAWIRSHGKSLREADRWAASIAKTYKQNKNEPLAKRAMALISNIHKMELH